ncbi:transmembrane protein 192 [Eurytemora carolleeae]|uniref:transmembrane protein 192 n=1 Tax=Eurytemora carolleeae TaxID=1294199 RepID=UPI000C76366C|nr:transmembrane protein 192 [Eurytemora carolleeae]|eukprot:XP_023345633.1 transmembrane protein 192-like [Eurytemora affinis]
MNSDEEVLVENGRKFQKVSTLPVAVIQIILCVCQIILVFMLPELCDKKGRECIINSFSLLIYTHGFHWCCILIMDQVLHFSHHKSRLNGYLDFYIRTKNIRRAPFYLVSAGNAVLMLVVIILHDLCDNNEACKHTNTKVDYLRGLITLESLIVICLVVNYIIVLRDFNTQQLPPDVLRDDFTSSVMLNRTSESVGYREKDQILEVMERQAEVIRYLREHSETLGRKILVLTNQLSDSERI